MHIFRKNNQKNLSVQQIEDQYKRIDSRGIPTLDKFLKTPAPRTNQPVPVISQPGPAPHCPHTQPVATVSRPHDPPVQSQVSTNQIRPKGKGPAPKKPCLSPTPGPSGIQNAAPLAVGAVRISNSNYVPPVSCC